LFYNLLCDLYTYAKQKIANFLKVCVGFEGCLLLYRFNWGLQLWIVAVYSVWHSVAHFGKLRKHFPKCAILNC